MFLLLREIQENEGQKKEDEFMYSNVNNNFQHMLRILFGLQLFRLTLCIGLTLPQKPSPFWIQVGVELDISENR